MTTIFIWLVTLMMIPISIGIYPMLRRKPKTLMMKLNYSYYMLWFMLQVYGIILCFASIGVIK